ncbi:MAG: flagellar protein FlgN [Deltaproteobacteria bacterium]|nr:flagellar protein FlgN [Deltaproteobacteria bacterium]
MEILLKELVKLLEDEIEIFRSLLPVFKKEKEAVLASDLHELNITLAKKEKLLFNMHSLEKERTHVMNKLAESLELSPDELTLKELARSVKKPYSIRIKNSGLQLRKLAKKISNANNTNRGMFAHSLNFVKGALTLLQNIVTPSRIYHRTGMVQAERQSGKVLSGEI